MNGFMVCWIMAGVSYMLLNHYFISIPLILLGFLASSKSSSKAIITWSDPFFPDIRCLLKIRASKCLSYLSKNSTENTHVTLTHIVSKALGLTLEKYPDLSGKLSFGNFVPHSTIDIGCLVAIDGGKDLGYFCLKETNKKPIEEISRESSWNIQDVRFGQKRKDLESASGVLKFIPTMLASCMIETVSWISVPLGLNIKSFNIEKHPCGSAEITNVSNFNVLEGYSPFPTVFKLSTVAVICSVVDEVILVNEKPVVDKVIRIVFTVDARFVDQFTAARALGLFKSFVENPELME